jgi:hypothetical protein
MEMRRKLEFKESCGKGGEEKGVVRVDNFCKLYNGVCPGLIVSGLARKGWRVPSELECTTQKYGGLAPQ